MNHIRCLLFDLDGTLLDSRDSVIDAVYATAEAHVPGLFTREAILARFGESFDNFMEVIETSLGGSTREQVFQYYFEHLNAYHDRTVRLFPGIQEELEALKASGYRLGIVTNKQRDFTIRGLQITGILQLFDSIVTVDDVHAGKPSAEPILRGMAELRALPEETAMVGDSKYDLLAAKAAGVTSVLVDWYSAVCEIDVCPDYYFLNIRELASGLALEKAK
ncbi:pyrophosphatase [Aneurinibacillus migulanus]|uniref:HAD family hydrolase n=1 Tax=Aneurinibacillus migulanus TaxID=47500 RepID=UPI0005BE070F|nr:HAD-IA family hydrolase [Aneurinibacillus migulanus]KIV51113.1 pyrophosphatase [Aneurinibacillus migulanus]KPD09454.1 pyrophosphatase [Aneurinibacillus migulanus]CEH31519.1 HAD hydrolase, family IA, variant 3 [Aneurinibacillus migulanus]